MFGQTAACRVGCREMVMGTPKQGLGLMGSRKRDSPSSFGLDPFSFRSPPMEVQPPVSPQQSECNPVGALQVCPHPHFPRMPVFP